jgi:hypothetical protein
MLHKTIIQGTNKCYRHRGAWTRAQPKCELTDGSTAVSSAILENPEEDQS